MEVSCFPGSGVWPCDFDHFSATLDGVDVPRKVRRYETYLRDAVRVFRSRTYNAKAITDILTMSHTIITIRIVRL
jgi:hypothetical protein